MDVSEWDIAAPKPLREDRGRAFLAGGPQAVSRPFALRLTQAQVPSGGMAAPTSIQMTLNKAQAKLTGKGAASLPGGQPSTSRKSARLRPH